MYQIRQGTEPMKREQISKLYKNMIATLQYWDKNIENENEIEEEKEIYIGS